MVLKEGKNEQVSHVKGLNRNETMQVWKGTPRRYGLGREKILPEGLGEEIR